MTTIIARATVPARNLVASIPTIELPKIHTSHREPEPATACPTWCEKHTTGTPGYPADRSTEHETARVTVATTFTSGPGEATTDRHTVEVWAERFDLDAEHDGHPVVGYPAVHLMVDGDDSTGMTAEQGEQVGRALLGSAAAARSGAVTTSCPRCGELVRYAPDMGWEHDLMPGPGHPCARATAAEVPCRCAENEEEFESGWVAGAAAVAAALDPRRAGLGQLDRALAGILVRGLRRGLAEARRDGEPFDPIEVVDLVEDVIRAYDVVATATAAGDGAEVGR